MFSYIHPKGLILNHHEQMHCSKNKHSKEETYPFVSEQLFGEPTKLLEKTLNDKVLKFCNR